MALILGLESSCDDSAAALVTSDRRILSAAVIGQNAAHNQLVGNTVRDNRKDGISFYSNATGNIVRDNVVSGNARYGIYVKSSNNLIDAGNQVFGNAIGIYLNAVPVPAVSLDTNRVYDNRDANVRVGGG